MNRRLGSCLALGTTLVLACGQRDKPADVEALAFDPALGRAFDDAGAGLELTEATPPASMLRWQPPS